MSISAHPSPIPREVMTFKQGCQYLSISERTGWDLVRRGVLPHFRIGKQIRFHIDDLRDWIRQQSRREEM